MSRTPRIVSVGGWLRARIDHLDGAAVQAPTWEARELALHRRAALLRIRDRSDLGKLRARVAVMLRLGLPDHRIEETSIIDALLAGDE